MTPTLGQSVIWFVCGVALMWAFYPHAKNACRRVIAWFRPEPLAPYSRYQDVEL